MSRDITLKAGKIVAKSLSFSGGLITAGGNGPVAVYSLEIEGIKTLLTSLESRTIAEALREMIQTKASSEWKHEYKGISLFLGVEEQSYQVRLSTAEDAKIASFDKWEVRALLKQIEHFTDVVEGKVYDFTWKVSAASLK